jgi:integrase
VIYDVVHKLPADLLVLAHQGSKAYSDTFELVYRRESDKPNAIWQADHTPLDILLVCPDLPAAKDHCRYRRLRLHEKGGKEHEMPTHHNLDIYLEEYVAAADIGKDRKGPLFRSARGRSGELRENPMLQSDVWRMIRRRAAQAGIQTEIGCHTFRATGITAYLKNGGRLEIAQQMAAHESSRTTGLYDRRSDEVSLDEVERIGI